MRKLTTKVLLSILSVSMCLAALGTSTFAWFSMNNTAVVQGMQLEASNDQGYLIAGTKTINGDGTFTEPTLESLRAANLDTVDLSGFYASHKAKPVAHETVSDITSADTVTNWYYQIADDRNAAASTKDKNLLDSLNGYVLTYDVYFALAEESVDMYNLRVSKFTITSSDATKTDLLGAVRILVASDTATDEISNTSTFTSLHTTLIETLTNDSMYHIRLYVFIDGAYETIYSNNFVNLANCSMEIGFVADDHQ